MVKGDGEVTACYSLLTIRMAQNDCARREAGHREVSTLGASARQFDALGTISMIPTWLKPLIAIAMLPSGVGIM